MMADLDLARVKRNVSKMVGMNAPEGDIDAYIASEGTTVDAVRAFRPQTAEAAPSQTAAPQPQAPAEGRGILRTVDDAVRGAADMLTFGFADEIAAKAGELTGVGSAGGSYDDNLAAERKRDSEGGGARIAGQVAGALAIPGAAARSIGGAALSGATMGGAYGFGSGEGGAIERAKSAGVGAITGGTAGVAVRGAANILTNKAAKAAIPSNEVLRRSADAAYKAADDAGVIIKPQSTERLTNAIKDDLAEFGYDAALQPGIGAVLNRLDGLGDQNVTLKGLDIIRRVAANAAKDPMNPSQQAAASKVIGHIDDFVGGLQADDVLAGNAKDAANKMLLGRSLWSRLKKSEAVDTAAIKADRRAASTGSGGNADNALRQNVRRLLDNPRTARGMTEAEKAAAERTVRGTKGQNLLRLGGKLAPTGVVSGGLGSSMGAGIGAAVGGPAGASVGALALPALGAVSKSLADRGTIKNAEFLSQIIRSGGKTAQDLVRMAQTGEGPPELVQAVQAILAKEYTARSAAVPLAAMAGDRLTD